MAFLQSLRLDGLLSFAPGSEAIPLTGLNVLIGPNGSGKSVMKVVVYVEGGGEIVAQRRTLRHLWEQPRAPFCRRRQNGRTDKDAQIKSRSIIVKGTEVSIASRHEQDCIALTDMVKNFDGGGALIEQWRKSKDTVLSPGCGSGSTTPISIPSNSRELETKPGATVFSCPRKSGSKQPAPSGNMRDAATLEQLDYQVNLVQ